MNIIFIGAGSNTTPFVSPPVVRGEPGPPGNSAVITPFTSQAAFDAYVVMNPVEIAVRV